MKLIGTSFVLFLTTAHLLGSTATEYAPIPTEQTMAGSWISVTSSGAVSRLVLDEHGVGEYAYDLQPGDVRIYDVKVTIHDYTIRIDAVARKTSDRIAIRGNATDESIWIEWSKKDKQRFQRETVFDQSLRDLREAMTKAVPRPEN